jgi:hypothetical protein
MRARHCPHTHTRAPQTAEARQEKSRTAILSLTQALDAAQEEVKRLGAEKARMDANARKLQQASLELSKKHRELTSHVQQ